MTDLPNFASWSNENLAKFAKDSYIKMQIQQIQIEELQLNFKNIEKVAEELHKILTPQNY
jgi:hypothetical protein